MTVQFCSSDELSDFLGTDIPDESQAQADTLLQLASAAIQAATRQTLVEVEDDVVTLNADGGFALFLPELPVTDVDEVKILANVNSGSDEVTLTDGTDYVWSEAGVLTRLGSRWDLMSRWSSVPSWPTRPACIEVTYTHGYAVIPDDLRMLTMQVAARSFGAPVGVRSESVDGVMSITYAGSGDSVGGVQLTDEEFNGAVIGKYRP